jgi:hypothetical protein
MDEAERLLAILDQWATGTGATIYLYGSRARGDYHSDSDADIFVDWPPDLPDVFFRWWCNENDDKFRAIGRWIGVRAEILDPDDKLMQAKIRAADVLSTRGCARAVMLPRIKPLPG